MCLFWAKSTMKKKQNLLESNKYLKDPKKRKEMIIKHAINSAKIEGNHLKTKDIENIASTLYDMFRFE